MPRYFLGALPVAVVAFLVSCAPSIIQQPTQFAPGTGKTFRLTRAAEVKLSTGYSTTLRSLSQGRATYTMEFKHYTEAPKNVADSIINKDKDKK